LPTDGRTALTPPTPDEAARPTPRAHGDGAAEADGGRSARLIAHAVEVLRLEAAALERLAGRLDASFTAAVDLVLGCRGQVVVTGMGKAGIIGQKISATLASTGTPSFYLHPAEALHGDLGRLRRDDLLVALSNSGETQEVNVVVAAARKLGTRVLGVTGRPASTLSRVSDAVLDIGPIEEACPLKLAPTASTTAMLALGDALAMAVLAERGFGPRDYARFHPAGSLGRRLMTVSEVMRTGDALPLVQSGTTVLDALLETRKTPGRPGAALIVDGERRLAGIFTDGDLRRLLERGEVQALHEPVDDHMVRTPKVLAPEQLAADAHRLLRDYRIDQAPVLDTERRPIGLVDVQDLLDVEL
jgi:arabinose-5-phosphate isomerase